MCIRDSLNTDILFNLKPVGKCRLIFSYKLVRKLIKSKNFKYNDSKIIDTKRKMSKSYTMLLKFNTHLTFNVERQTHNRDATK